MRLSLQRNPGHILAPLRAVHTRRQDAVDNLKALTNDLELIRCHEDIGSTDFRAPGTP